jgi:hypothetical protein
MGNVILTTTLNLLEMAHCKFLETKAYPQRRTTDPPAESNEYLFNGKLLDESSNDGIQLNLLIFIVSLKHLFHGLVTVFKSLQFTL